METGRGPPDPVPFHAGFSAGRERAFWVVTGKEQGKGPHAGSPGPSELLCDAWHVAGLAEAPVPPPKRARLFGLTFPICKTG